MSGTTVDVVDLGVRVKEMYRAVAEDPGGQYHFEVGRALAERLGYPAPILDRLPRGAVEFSGLVLVALALVAFTRAPTACCRRSSKGPGRVSRRRMPRSRHPAAHRLSARRSGG
ncbi:hypothetical protein [Agromyces bauzanensis]|nr:hypothetical protein [Agromyces bauzanensis]